MQPYQQRVAEEKAELDVKREKLGAFICCALYQALPEEEQSRLGRQCLAMDAYSEVLGERIAAFPDQAES